jgi:hypothetical protein
MVSKQKKTEMLSFDGPLLHTNVHEFEAVPKLQFLKQAHLPMNSRSSPKNRKPVRGFQIFPKSIDKNEFTDIEYHLGVSLNKLYIGDFYGQEIENRTVWLRQNVGVHHAVCL